MWALIAIESRGELGPRTPVAGVPLLVRALRLARRRGCAGAVVVGGDGLADVLAAAPLPVETAPDEASAPPREYQRIALLPPPPAATPAAATSALLRSLRKTVEQDGVVSYYALRPLGHALVRLLAPLGVRANPVTIVALLLGLASGLPAALGPAHVWLSGLLFFAAVLLDHVDGDLARLRVESSRLGEWLDTLADDLSVLAMLVGLGVGLGGGWLALGLAAGGAHVFTESTIYRRLVRLGGTLDTARFPWWFSDGAAGSPSPLSRLGFLVRRDVVSVAVLAAGLAGAARTLLALLAAGALVVFALMIAHLAIERRRAAAAARAAA